MLIMKLLFTDLDGTLLADNKDICEKNLRAIELLYKSGNGLVLSSGRNISSLTLIADRLDLRSRGCFCIAFNGARIFDLYEQKSVYKSSIPLDIAEKIFEDVNDCGLHIQTYDEKDVICESENENLLSYIKETSCSYVIAENAVSYLRASGALPPKILVTSREHPEKLKKLNSMLKKKYESDIETYYSSPIILEIVNRGVSKGAALEKLCRLLEVPVANSVAAGDAMNDLSLLSSAGIACAVKNSLEELKPHADYVTSLDNNDGAVAEIIEKFIL